MKDEPMTYDRRLIEDSLPLEIISEQSAREKSIRHGHISTLHIWWARRPLAAMRAAIFASLIPAPKDDKEREYLHRLIADIVNWDSVKAGNSPRIEEARALIHKYYPDAPPKVLDPFMGGGSTGLEALRLGCEAHGVELNPVAYLIQLCTLVYPQKYGQPKTVYPPPESELEQVEIPGLEALRKPEQLSLDMPSGEPTIIKNPLAEDVRKWGMWVLERTQQEVGHLYTDSEGGDVLAYFWAKTAKCPNPSCQAQMPLVGQYWLVRRGQTAIAVKPIISTKERKVTFEIAEGNNIDFDASAGTIKRSSVACAVCGTASSPEYLQQAQIASNRRNDQLMAVALNKETSGRVYRPINDYDIKLFEEGSTEYEKMLDVRETSDEDLFPIEEFPYLRSIFNIHVYGARTWGDLFNPRQAVTMVAFARSVRSAIAKMREEGIEENYAVALSTYLGIIFDRVLVRMTAYNIWDSTTESVMQIFNQGQSLPMRWDYIEVNPFSNAGGGSWSNCIDYICLVIEHASRSATQSAELHSGTALRQPFPDNSFDAIVTDPPYYDAVPYADLSDFFYVWLRRNLTSQHPQLFYTPLTPKMEELVQLAGRNDRYDYKDKSYFESQLTRAFSEIERTLSSNGIITIVFAHTSTSAWETVINGLLESKLVVTASWPLHTESRNRLRAKDSAALASSIFIICRRRQANDDGFYDNVRHEMRTRIKERLDFFWSQGIRGADFFISAIGPAVEVFGRYQSVRKLSGEVVSVADLLDLVQEAVADYTLSRVLNGRYKMGTVDAPTRFYVMYRWSYGGEKLLFDDARRLAQALGAEVNDLIHRDGILKQSGDSVTMPSATDRRKQEHLGEAGRDGAVPPVIDVLHRAVLIWQDGDRRALAEYLVQHALGREDEVHTVAQALVNVLPNGDRERQMLENFLQGSSDLPDVPRQTRLL